MDNEAYTFSEEDISWMEGLLEQAKVENRSRELAIEMLKVMGGEAKSVAHQMSPEQLIQVYRSLNDKELGRQ